MKTQHGSVDPFDDLLVLLDEIIQVFDLADFDGLTRFHLNSLQGSGVGPTLVDPDILRQTVLADYFLEETWCGLLVAAGGKDEV